MEITASRKKILLGQKQWGRHLVPVHTTPRNLKMKQSLVILDLCLSKSRVHGEILGSLSMHVFETRTATGSELFSLLTCLHTTEFALPSIFSPLEMLGIKIWETPLSWHAKSPLPVVVRVSETRVLKLPIMIFVTPSFTVSFVFKMFSVHTKTLSRHFQIPPV